MPLPTRFLRLANFQLAFERVLRGSNKDYKRFYRHLFPSYNLALKENLQDLIDDVKNGHFCPDRPTLVFQPKKSGILRPLTLLSMKDLIVYQALANEIAIAFEREQQRHAFKRTFGAIFAGKSEPFFYRSWKVTYAKYNEAISDAFKAGNNQIADFDLVSFYELIDHHLLRDRLKQRVKSAELLDLLFECLHQWTTDKAGDHLRHGVPQGPEASAFLAECFLLHFDEQKFEDVVYLRYIDDIKLMGRSRSSVRKALVKLDLESKHLGLVPQAQKIECKRVTRLKDVLKSVPSGLTKATDKETKSSQERLFAAFQRSIVKKGREWVIDDPTRFKYALSRLKARKDVLRIVAAMLNKRPDLCGVFANYIKLFPGDRAAANMLLRALQEDPTYDAAAASYIDVLDICEPKTENTAYRRTVQTALRRSVERSITLRISALSFRCKRSVPARANALIAREKSPIVRGALLYQLFGHPMMSVFAAHTCNETLKMAANSADPDLARFAAGMLLEAWPWFRSESWTPSAKANRSVALLMKGLGLRRRVPKKKSVLAIFFEEKYGIYIELPWQSILGKDRRDIETRCLRLQRLAVGDPGARIMMLDTFNEALIQVFSRSHPVLGAAYAKAIPPKKTHPDYGAWLHQKDLEKVLLKSVPWYRDVHKSRVECDLAHVKARATATHTRPISYEEADKIMKRAQFAWAELIREWKKIL